MVKSTPCYMGEEKKRETPLGRTICFCRGAKEESYSRVVTAAMGSADKSRRGARGKVPHRPRAHY